MPWGPAPAGTNLVIPSDAGPTDPRYEAGPDIRPELASYYLANYSQTVIFNALWWIDGTQYYYEVHLEPVAGTAYSHARGWYAFGAVTEAEMTVKSGSGNHFMAWGQLENVFAHVGPFAGIPADLGESWLALNPSTDFLIAGTSQGRGRRGSTSSTSNSAAIGTTETVILTISNFVWRAGRAYRVRYGRAITLSLSTNVGTHRLRKTNAAGALWGGTAAHGPSGAPPNVAAEGAFMVKRSAASDLTATVVLTLQASSAGTATQIGANPSARHLTIEDVGSEADFPEAFAVT